MYDFDTVINRKNTSSIKWNFQHAFGQPDGLLPYWIADTDFPTLPEITEAIQKRCEHPIIGYSAPLPSVYSAIQGWWERRHDWKPETEWMLLSFGVVTGIYFTLNALTKKEDKVLIFTPVYDPFFAAINNSGHKLVDCPLDYHDQYYTINWERFESELKNGVKAVLICNPHNPTGRVWSYEEIEKIADLCKEHNAFLLSDEIHADFGISHKYTTTGRFPQIYDNLVVYTAISKSFNMAGLGSSCMIVPNEVLRNQIIEAYDSRWMFGPCDLAYTAIEAAYTHGDKWIDEQCVYLQQNAIYTEQFLSENASKIQVAKHEGTFLMWLDMRCFKKTSDELTKLLAKEYGIALGNGSHYGRQSDGFMRLNIGCPMETLKAGLVQIAKMYADYIK